MGKFGNFLSQNFEVTQTPKQLIEIAVKLTTSKLILIEAGGHNGRDTREFLMDPKVEFAFVFEPDLGNQVFFTETLKEYGNRIVVTNWALSDRCGDADFYFPDLSGTGSGRSSLIKGYGYVKAKTVRTTRLDCFFQDSKKFEFENFPKIFWLDVEGSAYEVLKGSKVILNSIIIAKIELEFRALPKLWEKANFLKVCILMYKKGFVLYQIDLQPTFRGDAIFVKRDLLRKIKSNFYILPLALLLHNFIYPILFLSRKFRKSSNFQN